MLRALASALVLESCPTLSNQGSRTSIPVMALWELQVVPSFLCSMVTMCIP